MILKAGGVYKLKFGLVVRLHEESGLSEELIAGRVVGAAVEPEWNQTYDVGRRVVIYRNEDDHDTTDWKVKKEILP